MAQRAVLVVGLLLIAESQASDYDKFMAPNLNRVKHGNELGASPFTVVDDKPMLQSSTQVANNSADPISLSIFGIGLVSFVTMLGLSLWRALQPATTPVSALGGQVMEMTAEPAVFLVSPQKPSSKQTVRPFGGFGGGKSSSPAPAPAPDANDLGVLPPLGFFDPLGLAASGTAEDFERRRITELKHGRVAMAAFVGYLVPELYKWPGYLSKELDLKFEDVPNGLNALPVVPGLGWFQMIMVVGWLEAGPFKETRSEFAGDFGWPYFGKQLQNPEEKKRKLNMELQNGRAAMFGIMGLLTQDAVNGEVTIFPGTDIA